MKNKKVTVVLGLVLMSVFFLNEKVNAETVVIGSGTNSCKFSYNIDKAVYEAGHTIVLSGTIEQCNATNPTISFIVDGVTDNDQVRLGHPFYTPPVSGSSSRSYPYLRVEATPGDYVARFRVSRNSPEVSQIVSIPYRVVVNGVCDYSQCPDYGVLPQNGIFTGQCSPRCSSGSVYTNGSIGVPAFNLSNSWWWSCVGSTVNGVRTGNDATCHAKEPDATCGWPNGLNVSVANSDLTCVQGSVSNISTSNGRKFWDCISIHGAIVHCSTAPLSQTFSCQGSIPSNAAAFDAEESTGLTNNTTNWVYRATDSSAKCQFRCNSGYTWNGSSCVGTPPVVNGSCGTKAQTYASTVTAWPGGSTYCASGTNPQAVSNTGATLPAFPPAPGTNVSWVCNGSGGGANRNCLASRDLAVAGNSIPTATINFPNSDKTVLLGNLTFFHGSGVDIDGNITSYQWRIGDCNTGMLLSSTASSWMTLSPIGNYRIYLRVMDNDGAWSTNCPSVNMNVINGLPILNFNSDKLSVDPGESYTLSWAATNAVSCIATGAWNGIKNSVSGSEIFSQNFNTTYSLECYNASGVSTGRKDVTVIMNATPVNGSCGLAARNYLASENTFSMPFCQNGTPSPANPVFPTPGNSISWDCIGNTGGTDVTCSASRNSSVNLDPWKEVAP